jgi:hypothetical protein
VRRVTVDGDIEAVVAERFRAALRERRPLAEVLAWARAQRLPLTVTEIVTQDEYTHDILVEVEPRLCLVFDAT